MAGDARPNKRLKVDHESSNGGGGAGGGGGGGKWTGSSNKRNPSRAKYRAQAASNLTTRSDGNRGSLISATGLQSGDVGVFVTSDKGCEKKALREVEDLLSEIIDGEVGEGGGKEGRHGKVENGRVEDGAEAVGATDPEKGGDGDGTEVEDIEKDILAELEEMRGGSGTQEAGRNGEERGDKTTRHNHGSASSKLGLITLDIPCVSFIRLPQPPATTDNSTVPAKYVDPVELVYKICRQAYNDPTRPRSRYIKRLTPLTRVRKIMNEGIEKLCEEVLPSVFGIEQGRSWKYAVRVTVRNNQQVSKEDIIKGVAGFVVGVGTGENSEDAGNTSSEDETVESAGPEGKIEEVEDVKPPQRAPLQHKVDLKHFDKLILVEVYRNVVGMSVIGEAREFEVGLKRFNLSEIYAEGRKRLDEGKKEADIDGRKEGEGRIEASEQGQYS